MSKEEAKVVLRIMLQADGNCSYCAEELFRSFIKSFPQFEQIAIDVWNTEFTLGDLYEQR